MRTDNGAVRPHNEDRVSFVTPQPGDPMEARGSLMLVADGMGGHAAGEVASEIAVETVRRVYYELTGPMPHVLGSAFLAAHRAIADWAKNNPECKGMGTTCTAVAICDGDAWLAHVGDSRAYLLRDGAMTQLSEDQTLVAQMVRDGQLSPEEARNSPVSNVILQALGPNAEVVPVVWSEPLKARGRRCGGPVYRWANGCGAGPDHCPARRNPATRRGLRGADPCGSCGRCAR